MCVTVFGRTPSLEFSVWAESNEQQQSVRKSWTFANPFVSFEVFSLSFRLLPDDKSIYCFLSPLFPSLASSLPFFSTAAASISLLLIAR